MTNIAAMVAIAWLTNAVKDDRPSGEERYVTHVVSQRVIITLTNSAAPFLVFTNPVATNVSRYAWCEVPLVDERDPLSIRDIKSFPRPPMPPTNHLNGQWKREMRESDALMQHLSTNGVVCAYSNHVFEIHTRHVGVSCRQCVVCGFHEVTSP